ncbi:PREDICTED: DDB1- and CUL4-associated factor 8 isoform X2 [Ipomoea nil]|uniref:DDB1- and CUL4-associated factor 8 isoform X2 n=1 Tax=Ipomoea nil TaxID=35883 RepID=UPI000900C052|nr:PREDICTED: DDB1- and CUL4-associated factor 8 isoform X2 [Ipomoea nil]
MRNRAATGLDTAVVDVWKREIGQLSTRKFSLRLAAPEDLVQRLEIFRKLEKHGGCVNTVSFNADGDILVSGSDDRKVVLWDWQTGKIRLSFHSGHHNNVFQAKFMPYTEDRSIVTCAADGQIRHAQILAHGKVETKMLARHLGRAHKLAIEPGSPYILYSCGEDGLVQRIDLRTESATERFTCQPLPPRKNYMSFIHLNAIAMDPRNSNFFAVAGSDEYARLFDIRKCKWDNSSDFGQPVDFFCPSHLVGDESVGITGLAFSDQSELLVSYNDELIYMFSKNMGLGPDPSPSSPLSNQSDNGEMGPHLQSGISSLDTCAGTKDDPQAYKGHQNSETVKGVNFFGPKCEYVVSGSDCGRIFIWNKKGGKLVNVMEADKHVVNCIESHPHTTVLASSGIESDIKIWTPKATEKAVLPVNIQKVSMPRRVHFFGIRSLINDDDDDDDGGDGEYFLYDGSDGDDDNITDEEVDEEENDDDDDDDDDNITDEEDDVDDNITDEEVEEAGEDNIINEEVGDDNITNEDVEEDEDDFFSDTDDYSNNDDTTCDEVLDDAEEENGSEEEFYDGIDDCDVDDITDEDLDAFSNIEYDEEHDG